MDSQVVYFKSIKSRSVAIMGANNKAIFYKEKVTGISDPDDIYIYRKKDTLLIETDADGVPIKLEPGMVLGRDGIRVRPAPLSHSVYQGFEGAKRRQLQAEENMNRQDTETEKNNVDDGKADLDEELSAEDDLSVDSGDFNFEDKDDEKKKVKKNKKSKAKAKAKVKKDSPKKKKSAKKKVSKKKESAKSSKKKKNKKLDDLRKFSS